MSKVVKRGATSGLTRDNWDEEDTPEEMGVFKKASADELKNRPMRKARRRDPSEVASENSVFKGFSMVSSAGATAPPSFSFLNNSSKSPVKPTFNFNGSNSSNTVSDKPMFTFGLKDGKPKDKESSDMNATDKLDKTPMFNAPITSPPTEFKMTSPSNTFCATNKSSTLPEAENNKNNADSKRELYLNNLKGLNLALLSWIKLHIEKSAYINMTPIFEDYKSHLEGLDKKYNCDDEFRSGPAPSSSVSGKNPSTCTGKGFNEISTSSEKTNGLSSESAIIKQTKPPEFTFGGKLSNTNSTLSASSSFSFGSAPKSSFTFGSTEEKTTSQSDNEKAPAFSFGIGTGGSFSFGTKNTTSDATKSNEESKEDASYEPPKVEVEEIKEENSIYEKKCKLFYKKDDSYADRGVGTLYLKLVGTKTQLLIRALTNLGNILLNVVLNESIPTQRVGKNNVLIVCVPNPPINPKETSTTPVSMLIRVKTSDDADELLAMIEKHKKTLE